MWEGKEVSRAINLRMWEKRDKTLQTMDSLNCINCSKKIESLQLETMEINWKLQKQMPMYINLLEEIKALKGKLAWQKATIDASQQQKEGLKVQHPVDDNQTTNNNASNQHVGNAAWSQLASQRWPPINFLKYSLYKCVLILDQFWKFYACSSLVIVRLQYS